MGCSFAAQRDFGAIDAVNTRVAGGGAAGRDDGVAGQEAELHEAAGDIVGQVEMIEHTGFAFGELSECTREWAAGRGRGTAIDTHLQNHQYLPDWLSTSRTRTPVWVRSHE